MNIEHNEFDYKILAGLSFSDAVQVILKADGCKHFMALKTRWKRHNKNYSLTYELLAKISFAEYYQYDAQEDQGLCVIMWSADVDFSESEKDLLKDWSLAENKYWTDRACTFLSHVIGPLSSILEHGLLEAEGQKEPVMSLTQAYEPIPYHVFDNRCWRLISEKSRLEVLDKYGKIRAIFKRVRLIMPSESSQPQVAPSSRKRKPEVHRIHASTVEDARRLLTKEWDIENTGSQRVAREFTDRYPEYGLSLRAVQRLADECRGGPRPRGRPIGR